MIAQRSNNILVDIFIIFVGVVILLVGMAMVNCFVTTELASFIDIIPMLFAIWFIVHFLHLRDVVNKSSIKYLYLITFVLTFLVLIFSLAFVFNETGYFYTLEKSGIRLNEHAWAYNNIRKLSHYSLIDLIFEGNLKHFHLGKYSAVFAYCSLMFRYGGDVLTHICIWRAFHLCLVAILVSLSAYNFGVDDKKRLSMIMIVSLFIPMLDTLFAYNHDSVGYTFIALGFYILSCTHKNNLASLIAFPLYAFLFFWFRRPYAVIAVALYFWSILRGNRNKINILLGSIIIVLILSYFTSTINFIDFVNDDLGFAENSNPTGQVERGFINKILVTTLGYFPWTNLLKNVQWPYALFACFQGAMNVTIMYYIFIDYRNKLMSLFNNPFTLSGVLFFLAAMAHPGHISYTSVAIPFFLAALENVTIKRVFRTYSFMILIIFMGGLIYKFLGIGKW